MTRLIAVLTLASLFAAPPAAAQKRRQKNVPSGKMTSERDKVLYAIGAELAQELMLTPGEVQPVFEGIRDAAKGRKLKASPDAFRAQIERVRKIRKSNAAQAFLDKAAAQPGAKRFPSGLIYKVLRPGTGARPAPTDRVKVHYHGTFPDGKIFDSSVNRGIPSEFPLNGVIRCWTEGVAKMQVGEKSRLICPYSIAYGERGRPPVIPPSSTLVFEVELLDILK